MSRRQTMLSRGITCAVFAATFITAGPAVQAAPSGSAWPMFGQNIGNTSSTTSSITTSNIAALKPKWAFTTGGDVSARAAVVNGVAYFPDWSGHLYAIRSSSGKLLWSKTILSDYLSGAFANPPAKVVSRTSPAVDPSTNTVYLGTQSGAYLLAVDATTGALKWRTKLDPHPLAIDTSSPAVLNGVVYVGVASLEEAAAINPDYPCCTFRGSAIALNAATGEILWKRFTVPPGYNGGAVWASTLVPDTTRGLLYVTTGNNYYTPTDPAYATCIAGGGTPETCNSPDDHFDSVLALRLDTGAIAWSDRLASSDDWNVSCFINFVNCPVNSGPDFDFGSGANLITVSTPQGPKQILGAGQKSGVYSAIDPSTGAILWATQVGPGSSLGGMEWGSASDGTRIYVSIADFYGIPNQLASGGSTTAGSWAALDPLTGRILWQVADPNTAVDLGPLTVSNGVVYTESMAGGAGAQTMFGLNAATGQRVWSFAAGSSVIAGASIANDTVYWGSGYSNLGLPGFTGNTKLYAFTIGGQ